MQNIYSYNSKLQATSPLFGGFVSEIDFAKNNNRKV